MKAYLSKFGKVLIIFCAFLAGSVLLITASVYLYLSPKLPSAETLRTVKLQTPLRIYSRDHRLMAEFGEKRRNPLEFNEIPETFVNAILAAEDDNFFHHSGVDITGLMRAAGELAVSGSIQSGGSTITMQVARNFFLTREQSFIRKFNEILLAFRIEDDLTKEEIFTLYANKIYLGNRAYGIEAAARVYYGISVNELTLDQMAMIAGLPKAPSRYNPLANAERATTRRNWILGRMLKLGQISQAQYDTAVNAIDIASYHSPRSEIDAPYVAEMARQEAIERWGLDAYTEGYVVTTTLDSNLQAKAAEAVRHGLHAYDDRHGYRGPEQSLPDTDAWQPSLQQITVVNDLIPAIITEVSAAQATLMFQNAPAGTLELAHNKFRLFQTEDSRSPLVTDLTTVFKAGDVIRVRADKEGVWKLSQIPKAQAALVAIDPENGALRALVGGYSFSTSNFNRATQATRQPGSNFKPFIYTRALEKGMSPASLINDAPIVFHDPHLEKVWRPENDSGKFYGPTPLRMALYRSRNVVSIRLLRQIGIKYAIRGMGKFGFDESTLPQNLSLALGTLGTTPLNIAQGYTVFANGGYKVRAYLIDKAETIEGDLLYQANPATVCRECGSNHEEPALEEPAQPFEEAESLQALFSEEDAETDATAHPSNPAETIVDPRVAFMMDSILRDVIQKGTGRKALVLERKDLGGKTGTTNGPRDAWFSGYNPNLVTTVWVGFDENLLLGRNEYGGSAALPIWIDFMKAALEGIPDVPRPQPAGLITIKVSPSTGRPVSPGDPNGIFEYFIKEKAPSSQQRRSNSGLTPASNDSGVSLPDDLF